MKKLLFYSFFSIFCVSGFSQILINTAATPQDMVANLVGPGVTFSNVTYTGAIQASATFSNGSTTNLGMNSGVVLTSGSANLIPVNNSGSEGVNNGTPGIPQLNAIAGATTFDGVILEFDFIPLSNQINVNYIFGSEEYLEFVNSSFNDAFAFFISGPGIVGEQNIATVGGLPVTIDNVNHLVNTAFFVNNTSSSGPNSIEYDGFTTVLTATRTVIPCSTYHIKLMIADGGDGIYDSGVFIAENGLFSPNAQQQVSVQPAFNFQNAIEGCSGSQFTFSIGTAVLTYTDINFTVGGTATPGQDYVPLPNSVSIPPGQTSVVLPVTIIDDGIVEGPETIVLTVQTSLCSTETFTMTIVDPTPISVTATGATMCQGAGPVSISASATGGNGPITYSWSNGAGNGATVSVNPATTTSYTVTATDQCGKTATATATVTVTPPPTSTFSVTSPICQGSTSTVTYTGNALAGADYTWNFGGGTAVPGGNSAGPHTVSWAGTGNMNISLTVSQGGCTSGVTNQTVVVNPTPPAPVLGSNSPICQGSSLNLTANAIPNATYFWSGPGGWTSGVQNPVIGSATPANSGTYSAYVVVNGCTSATSTLNVTINATPAAPVIGSNSPVCDGGTLNLTSNTIANATYFWSGPGGWTSSLEDPTLNNVNQAQAGNYTLYVVVSGCTSAVSSTSVTIAPPLAPVLSSNSPVCEGGTLNLSTDAIPGASYFWSGPDNFSSGQQNPTLSPVGTSASGTYSAYLVISGCTSATATLSVTINPTPASPQLSSNSPICAGQNLLLNANTIPGATYSWSGPNGFVSSLEDPGIGNTTTANSGTYSAYVVVAGCTSSVSDLNVMVNPIPAAPIISSNSPVCEGDDILLSADTYPGATYFWSGVGGFSSGLEDPVIASASVAESGTYSLYIVENGCTSATSDLSVSVELLPVSDFALTPTVCAGGQAFALYAGNAPANATYNWSSSGNAEMNGSGQGPITFVWQSAGQQTVSLLVSVGNCVSPVTTQNVNIIGTIAPDAGPDQTVCSGGTVDVGNVNQQGQSGFSWLTPNGINDPGSGYSQGAWVNNGTAIQSIVLVLQSDNQGCLATDTTVISVVPYPTVSIQQPAPQCLQGNSFSFSATGNILPIAVYAWSFSGAIPASSSAATPSNVVFSAAGTQQVVLTVNQSGCTASDTISVTVNPNPQALFGHAPGQGCIPLTVSFSNQSISPTGAPLTYSWNFGNGVSGNQASPTTVYSEAGVYSVSLTVTDPIGCSSTLTQNNIIQVYPPPVAGFSASPMSVYIDQPIVNVYDGSVGNVSQWNYSVSNGMQFGSPNFSISFSDTGTFVIVQTVSDGFGCSASSMLEVQVLPVSDIFIPNAFTPGNKDNLNNIFKPIGTNLADYRMFVFNRWGELLFSTTDLDEGWDGTVRNSGIPAKEDSYVYKVEYVDHKGNPQAILGHVTIVR